MGLSLLTIEQRELSCAVFRKRIGFAATKNDRPLKFIQSASALGFMSKKKKVKVHEQSSVALPWWKTACAKFTLIPLGTIVTFATLILIYKTTGADELRAQVYQPLFADIVSVEESVQAISAENPAVMKALPGLRRSGAFELIPRQTQRRIVKVSEDISIFHIAINAVREIALREMSARIVKIRSKEGDQIWQKKTEGILREMSKSKNGISDSVTLLSAMKHEARSRAIDIRNPAHPEIAGPGGPTFVVRDWITYPGSIQIIEDLWTDVDYLTLPRFYRHPSKRGEWKNRR